MAEQIPHHNDQDMGEGTQALVRTLHLGFGFLRGLILVMLLIFVVSGIFILDQNEQAFILRFGKIVDASGTPIREKGTWHWAWPKPIDHVIRYRVGENKTLVTTSFWYNEPERNVLSPEQEQPPPDEGPEGAKLIIGKDGYLLTADTNILHTKWAVTYHISDPIAYYRNYENPEAVLKATLDTAILHQTSKTPINVAFPGGQDLRIAVEGELRELLAQREVGIVIDQLNFDAKTPPKSTLSAFLGVTKAREERSKLISEAEKYANNALNQAKGEEAQIIAEAETYSAQISAAAAADAKYIEKIRTEYEKTGPAILTTLYADTLLEVVGKAKTKYIVYPDQELRIEIGDKKKSPNTPAK